LRLKERVMENFLTTGLGVLFGGIITSICSRHYYKKATIELEKEAGKLRDLNHIILCAMESLNWIELETDEQGNISGFKVLIQLGGETFKVPVKTK
jgi:hypothetical protein